MKRQLFLLMALLGLAGRIYPVTAQDLTQWDAVRQISAGQELRVELRNKQKHNGFVVAVTDSEIQLEKEGDVLTLRQSEIKKVWHVTDVNRTRQKVMTSAGLGAGLFAGLMIGVSLGMKPCGDSCKGEGAGFAAAIIGLPAAGAILGRKLAGSGKRTLVYAVP